MRNLLKNLSVVIWVMRSLNAWLNPSVQVSFYSFLFLSSSSSCIILLMYVTGVYAGDPSKLSMKAAFGRVWILEQKGGSIIAGTLKTIQERRSNPKPPRDSYSFYSSFILSFSPQFLPLLPHFLPFAAACPNLRARLLVLFAKDSLCCLLPFLPSNLSSPPNKLFSSFSLICIFVFYFYSSVAGLEVKWNYRGSFPVLLSSPMENIISLMKHRMALFQ